MDEILKALGELEAVVENARSGFMGKRLINEEEFFTCTQKLRSQMNALSPSANRDILTMAMSLPRDERRKLAEWLSRD